MIAEAAFYGRAKDQTTGSTVTLNFNLYRVHTVATTSGSINIKLQSARQLQKGGPIGYVINSGSNSFNLVDNSNNLLATMAAGDAVTLALIDNATAAGSWIVIAGTANFVADPPVNLHFFVFGGEPSTLYDSVSREYDSQLDSWTVRSSIPTAIGTKEGALVAFGSKSYFVGIDDGSGSSTNYKKIVEYDPDTFTLKTSGSVGWQECGGVTLGTSIVFFNGQNGTTQWDVQSYLVSGDSWTAQTERPSGRRQSWNPCAGVNSKAVLTDGLANETDTYVIDTWTAKTSRPGASTSRNASVENGTDIYSYGGAVNVSTNVSNVYTYVESTDTWSAMSAMTSTRAESATCSIGAFNYIAGGIVATAGGHTDLVEEHTIAADTYLTKSSLVTSTYKIINQGAAITP